MSNNDQKQPDEVEEVGGLDDDVEENLTLISSDESNPKRFEISRQSAVMCNLVKSILEGDSAAKEIPIKKIRGDILELIVEYLQYHKGKKPADIQKPIRSVKMERIVEDKWDAEFINKMNKKTIFQVILGANYMDLPSLLHLGCAKIATLIKGKSPEEIKSILADDSVEPKPEETKDDN
jgi:S-phase kinase-associated protein 1